MRKIRRQIRARLNDLRLSRESARYEVLFSERGLRIPDEQALRELMRTSYPSLKPAAKDSLSIISVFHHYNWEKDSLLPALERFGRVRHYDRAEPFHHEMNNDLLKTLHCWLSESPADVIFSYLSGENVTPETVEAMRRFGVPMINLALNDKEHFVGKIRAGKSMGSRDICRYFDLCWTSTEDALEKYCVEGATPVYLPEGANPDIHRPFEEEKVYDVSFVGQCYGNRPEIVSRLQSLGINVAPYGSGWPNGPLPLEKMVLLYSRSRINLGFAGIAGHRDAFCLKGRDFEVPMSGGLYLTEHHPELERVYDIGREIVTYSGFDDLVGKIRFLLTNPEKAEEIRRSGFRRARMDHTWEKRFERIFSLIGLI